jgi:hypothetical protein
MSTAIDTTYHRSCAMMTHPLSKQAIAANTPMPMTRSHRFNRAGNFIAAVCTTSLLRRELALIEKGEPNGQSRIDYLSVLGVLLGVFKGRLSHLAGVERAGMFSGGVREDFAKDRPFPVGEVGRERVAEVETRDLHLSSHPGMEGASTRGGFELDFRVTDGARTRDPKDHNRPGVNGHDRNTCLLV